MKTILQDGMSGLYFSALGRWVNDPNAAFGFKSCGRAVDFCLRHGLWGTRVILMLEPNSQAIVMTLEQPVRSVAEARFSNPARLEEF